MAEPKTGFLLSLRKQGWKGFIPKYVYPTLRWAQSSADYWQRQEGEFYTRISEVKIYEDQFAKR